MIQKVSLIGAGPGDPGLLTVKALKRIEDADLIIYDTLANPDHLRHAKPSATKICVGKGFRYHRLSQNKINHLIIREAKKGKKIVRLKGGDPYLFGRGGEEALFLKSHRIPFEVIPGVTSATACAATAGIPLTHRDHNASVTFLTGHRAGDKDLNSIDWRDIVRIGGTLVIYMGFYNLGKIAEQLIQNGMRPETKIAVIEWGTLPRQKSCDGNLKNIQRRVLQKGMKAPAIIIIGDVVALREKLNWYEALPLFGKTVVITRMREKSGSLADKLTELGAQTLEFPVIEIQKISHFGEMDAAIERLFDYDWIIFTSTYGVEAFFGRLKNHFHKDARALASVRIASVGPETTRAIEDKGIHPDLEPERFETEALVEAFEKRKPGLEGKRVLLFRTQIAPPALVNGLRKLGADVKQITAYRTVVPKSVPADVRENLLKGLVDIVTFTSSSTVTHFVKLVGLKNVLKMARRTKFVSIGPVTSATLKTFGLKPHYEARHFTIDGLIETMTRHR